MKAILAMELFKIYKQGKTWYALGAIFLIELIIFITAYLQGATILDLLLSNLRESFYFEGNLLNGNLVLYIVLNSLWFNLPLILMIVTSALVTEEYKNGTLQTTLLQAVKKQKLILAKYLAALIFTIVVLMLLMASSFLAAYLVFGNGDLVVYLNTLNFFTSEIAVKRIALAFVSGTLSMVFYTSVSVTFGILIKEPAKTWIASAFFLILCSLFLKIDVGLGSFDFLFFPKLTNSWQDFFSYSLDWSEILVNHLALSGYTLLSTMIGIYLFIRTDIG
ncbi:MAG: ABC transporter permease [Leeuwenhoekiella sp.]